MQLNLTTPVAAIAKPLLFKAFVLALAVAVWQALVYYKVYRFGFLPSVPQVTVAFFEYIPSSRFVSDLWSSGSRVLTAWSLALLLGVPLGLVIGWKASARDFLLPAVELLRPIPPIAWIPAAIIFFPSAEPSVVFICFIGAFFPIVLNTFTGARQIDETYFRAARCCGAGEFYIFRHVVLRGSMPYIVIGAAVGMGICWMAVVSAEMIAGDHGLGYMIWEAYSLAQYPLIIVGMFAIGVFGALMSVLIRTLEKWLVPWQKP
ncbi:MAG TPA: ABC transporter permease [Xanthobacteraceae bacterium]|jgi:NitT/TauT family transport system permease protein|nr:ABC transporter permease [Xanthobacteraceae bacterium]